MYKLIIPSKIGLIKIVCDETHLVEVSFSNSEEQSNPNEICWQTKEELDGYFNRKLKGFNLPIRYNGTGFQVSVWKELVKVPYGELITYQELANRVGKPKGVRAVANAVGKNQLLIINPCHRVIGSNHTLTGFSAGINNKIKLLELEGYKLTENENPRNSRVIIN